MLAKPGRLANTVSIGFDLPDISQSVSIRENVFCQFEKKDSLNFTDKKVALVAHFDPDSIVAPYVDYYLKALKEQGYAPILISTARLHLAAETQEIAQAVLWRSCPGYDFTSWKAAFEYYPSLYNARELLLTNDSIFGPMHSLAPLHQRMDTMPCDFWGLVFSREGVPHLQSYYLVFRKNTLCSQALKDFFLSVDTTEDKTEVVSRYELGLTHWLQRYSLRGGAYLAMAKEANDGDNGSPIHIYWRELLRDWGIPFVKRDVIADKNWWLPNEGWERNVADTGYPVSLIKEYMQRTANRVLPAAHQK